VNSREELGSLTDRSYWDETWQSVEIPKRVDPSDHSLGNQGTLALHTYFSEVLAAMPSRPESMIEIGCAQSKWLPYFAQVHHLAVAGLDYSELGCTRARALLDQARCVGEVVQADMFQPPQALQSRFDVVLSMGLVEHFDDTASAVRACAAMAKKDGLVVTLVPNLAGVVGFGQRWLDRAVYDKHVPLDREALRRAHEASGLSIVRSEYLLSANFAVINHPNLRPKLLNRLVRGLLVAATGCVWVLERIGLRIPPTRLLSPYVACVGRKLS